MNSTISNRLAHIPKFWLVLLLTLLVLATTQVLAATWRAGADEAQAARAPYQAAALSGVYDRTPLI